MKIDSKYIVLFALVIIEILIGSSWFFFGGDDPICRKVEVCSMWEDVGESLYIGDFVSCKSTEEYPFVSDCKRCIETKEVWSCR